MKAVIKFCLQVLYNVGFMTFFFITGPFFLWQLWRRGKLLPQFVAERDISPRCHRLSAGAFPSCRRRSASTAFAKTTAPMVQSQEWLV